jgi:hypothetical protein
VDTRASEGWIEMETRSRGRQFSSCSVCSFPTAPIVKSTNAIDRPGGGGTEPEGGSGVGPWRSVPWGGGGHRGGGNGDGADCVHRGAWKHSGKACSISAYSLMRSCQCRLPVVMMRPSERSLPTHWLAVASRSLSRSCWLSPMHTADTRASTAEAVHVILQPFVPVPISGPRAAVMPAKNVQSAELEMLATISSVFAFRSSAASRSAFRRLVVTISIRARRRSPCSGDAAGPAPIALVSNMSGFLSTGTSWRLDERRALLPCIATVA